LRGLNLDFERNRDTGRDLQRRMDIRRNEHLD
jgi:hypothetical protein